jgi:hypothetical protein
MPYPSARKDDCLAPGAGPEQVARRVPSGRLMAQPEDTEASNGEPSLTLRSWTSRSLDSGSNSDTRSMKV